MPESKTSKLILLKSPAWDEYALLDSGDSRKLEQFGPYRLARFESQAKWKPALPLSEWQKAEASFTIQKGQSAGQWQCRADFPREWQIGFQSMRFQLRVRDSRHIGLFPEQNLNWLWLEEKIKKAVKKPRILNLFGYTGAASLFAARAGAAITHVDASRAAEKWGQVNQALSGLDDLPLRWIVDDAFKFVKREIRRGSLYDGLLLDPPRFGRGPKGEVWKFDKAVPQLLNACCRILAPAPLLVCLTAYDVENEPNEIGGWLTNMMRPYQGSLEFGWLVQVEKSAGRTINQSMFARWSAKQ